MVIDLKGPDGNALVLVATAKKLARDLRWTPAKIEALSDEMLAGDYDNLVRLFRANFNDYITLVE